MQVVPVTTRSYTGDEQSFVKEIKQATLHQPEVSNYIQSMAHDRNDFALYQAPSQTNKQKTETTSAVASSTPPAAAGVEHIVSNVDLVVNYSVARHFKHRSEREGEGDKVSFSHRDSCIELKSSQVLLSLPSFVYNPYFLPVEKTKKSSPSFVSDSTNFMQTLLLYNFFSCLSCKRSLDMFEKALRQYVAPFLTKAHK